MIISITNQVTVIALTLLIVIKSFLINKAKHLKLKCNKLGGGGDLKFIPVKSVQSALSDLKRPPERLQSQCNYRLFIT